MDDEELLELEEERRQESDAYMIWWFKWFEEINNELLRTSESGR